MSLIAVQKSATRVLFKIYQQHSILKQRQATAVIFHCTQSILNSRYFRSGCWPINDFHTKLLNPKNQHEFCKTNEVCTKRVDTIKTPHFIHNLN